MKQDSHKTTKRFDPLLFNGLGSERERKWNNIVNVIMYDISIIIGVISFVFFNVFVIQKSNNNIWIFLYIIYIITFIIYCILWFYLFVNFFHNTLINKHIDKSNPLLVCEYQSSFKNYCVWILGATFMFIVYLICSILAIAIPPIICFVLMHLYWSKPFLLKRILLFEDCVVLEYRIFGNMKLSRENLALIQSPTTIKSKLFGATAFVLPVIFDNTKYKYFITYLCTRFSVFGLSNLNKLWEELDSQMGYSAENMINPNRVMLNTLKSVIKENQ
ncbi:hypothetical protein CQA53_10605 [Helicobacter didelphidarum]|uniref:Uncharacterized protein n=1 Tax=Helicobacter didelphidarum TaxID=2040648 RepID=A0A3D8I6T4_9HELI|nr:hypothetical protein [Helicobacter didelphidarum]RDU60880.1 hypothetical protein CQA53_10605 [Helicobacter didelphidarum]